MRGNFKLKIPYECVELYLPKDKWDEIAILGPFRLLMNVYQDSRWLQYTAQSDITK